jgi:LPS-assembly protein
MLPNKAWLAGFFCFVFLFLIGLFSYGFAKELPVHLDAQYLKYDEDEEILFATGEVKIVLEDIVLRADSLEFDLAANLLTAEGNVQFEVNFS